MRGFAQCAALGIVAAGLAGAPVEAQPKDAATVIAAARQALGGEKKLAAVKSFTAQGRTRQVRGENLVPIEFEIFVELPDKYLRKDEIPAQESGPTASGFTGDELLLDPLPAAPMPDPARKARVTQLKQDFARLALGMFAGTYPAYPLTFTYVGQAEAPQGKADVVDAKGPDNTTFRFFINSDTHLPVMLTWQPPAPPARGGGPGRGAPGAGGPPAGPPPAAGAAPPPPQRGAPPAGAGPAAPRPELRLYFADYRDVDGLQLPFRIRRATGAETTEETTFDRYRINPKIDPRRFDVRK
jgi:hypothetical protein